MKEAVIISTARTPIGRAFRGAFNNIKSPTMAAHAIRNAVDRSGVADDEIDDLVFGSVLNAGSAAINVARLSGLAAGLPVSVPAQTVDRQCSSGMMAIAIAARQIVADNMQVVVAGGQDNISEIQTRHYEWAMEATDENVILHAEHAYMPMLPTAEQICKKYNITRESQDEYALSSQQRTAAAQADSKLDDEIVPLASTKSVKDKETGEVSYEDVMLEKDEGNRPETTLENLQALQPVIEGGVITAGNASQLSDGASACVLMESGLASKRGIEPLGIYRGMAVAGNEPEEMGIGPVYAVPKLLKQHGLDISDIGLWELNEAFACQALYCR
ncbi:MAG: acetyl-CoA C-acyltransferase, partial [Gammaproteobacteria bacterium]|nr:acetyl-CoA C-acyltransferase [Gammaproteobacteria bacterium]